MSTTHLQLVQMSKMHAWHDALCVTIYLYKMLTLKLVISEYNYPISKKIWRNSARNLRSGWRCPQLSGTPKASRLYDLNFFSRHEPLAIISTVRSDCAFSTDMVKSLPFVKR